jgi:hypothetical protein
MNLSALMRVLIRNGFQVDYQCYPRLAQLVGMASLNSVWGWFEYALKSGPIEESKLPEAPIFILGHWRSGTTHLHNLLCCDRNFAAPSAYAACFPNHFVFTQSAGFIFNLFAPRKRPMDNVAFASFTPHEDEFAVAAASTISPYLKALFPLTEDGQTASLDPSELAHENLQEWKKAFRTFLKKVSLTEMGDLVIKAPPHTARIPILLEMFPRAKFIYLYRNPYDVFASTRILWERAFGPSALQRAPQERIDDLILSWYKELISLYERDKILIPKGSLHEMSFEALERDPLEELENLYTALRLPDFTEFQGRVKKYLDSISSYSKNKLELSKDDIRVVNEHWREGFERYGYTMVEE